MSLQPFCFATLTPENKAAQKCLESLIDSQPPDSHIHLVTIARPDAKSRQIKPTDRAAQSKYQLMFLLDDGGSTAYPSRKDDAWTVGKLGQNSGVDLPLCSSRSRQLQGLRFFSVSIHPQSGAFVITNLSRHHSIVYLQADNSADVELQYNAGFVLHMQTNRLRIGPLDLVLEFTASDEATYAINLESYMRKRYQSWDHNLRIREYGCLDLLPRATQVETKMMITHHTVSKGAFGVVRAGVDKRSGVVVACKTIHCARRHVESVRREIEINLAIAEDTIGVVPIFESWCEHNHALPCSLANLEDVHLLMPFAPYTFATAPWQHIDLPTRLALFHQVLEGLQNLHTMGIMHRDISPSNLLIFSCQGPETARAGIADFGKAKRGVRGKDTGLGPPGFTSPEVGRLVEGYGYTNAIDVFSLGLSMAATYMRWNGADPITRDNHAKILTLMLMAEIPESLGALLRSMIAWDPSSRPTAKEALADPVWGQIAVVEPDQDQEESQGSESVAARLQRSGGLSLSSTRWANKRILESAEQTAPKMQSGAHKKTRIRERLISPDAA